MAGPWKAHQDQTALLYVLSMCWRAWTSMLLSVTARLKVYYNSMCLSQALVILTVGSLHRVTNRNTGTGVLQNTLFTSRWKDADWWAKDKWWRGRHGAQSDNKTHCWKKLFLAFLVIEHNQFSRYNYHVATFADLFTYYVGTQSLTASLLYKGLQLNLANVQLLTLLWISK